MNRNIACKGKVPFNIFAQADGFPQLNEKKPDLVCLIFIEGCPSLMKINVGLYIKKIILTIIMRRGLQGKNYFQYYFKITINFREFQTLLYK